MAFPALDALREGYEVYPVVDAIGGTSEEAHRAGLERVVQAGRPSDQLGRARRASSSATGRARRRWPTSSRSCSPSVCSRHDRRLRSPIPRRASSSGTPTRSSRALIDAHPDFRPRAWIDELPPLDAFGTLIFQVAGQQLSVSATRTIVSRLEERFGGHLPSPAELLAADPQVLRAQRPLGPQGRDAAGARGAVRRRTPERRGARADDRRRGRGGPDRGLRASGRGRRTASCSSRSTGPTCFLSGDLALRRAIQRLYGFDHLPTEDEMARGGGALAAVPEPRGELPVRVRIRRNDEP